MGYELSPERKKRRAEARARREKRWKDKAGPLTIRYVCPTCGGAHPDCKRNV